MIKLLVLGFFKIVKFKIFKDIVLSNLNKFTILFDLKNKLIKIVGYNIKVNFLLFYDVLRVR